MVVDDEDDDGALIAAASTHLQNSMLGLMFELMDDDFNLFHLVAGSDEQLRRQQIAAAIGLLSLQGNIGSLAGRVHTLRPQRFVGLGNVAGLSKVEHHWLVRFAQRAEFRRVFRVSPELFERLEQRLGPSLRTKPGSFRSDAFSVRDRIGMFWVLSLLLVFHFFSISRTHVRSFCRQFTSPIAFH